MSPLAHQKQRALVAIAALVAGTAATLGAPAIASAAPAAVGSTYVALPPVRILDTRHSLGGTTPGANGVVPLTVLGVGGVPATGVTAVVLTVTVTAPGAAGHVTVYPAGGSIPTASNVNFAKGETVPNLVVVQPGTGGVVDLDNATPAPVQLIADVSGYYAAPNALTPGGFVPVAPTRLLDTRTGLGGSTPAGHGTVHLQVSGRGPVPSTGVTAVVVNLTVTGPGAAGYVTAYPDLGYQPTSSSINFTPGQTVANLAVVQLGSDGKIALYNGATAPVQVIVDVAGYYLAGTAVSAGTFVPSAPYRQLDTRQQGGAPGANGTYHLLVDGIAALPPTGVSAVVVNVTVVRPTAPGHITIYADGGTAPNVSSLNFATGQTVANTVVAPVGPNGKIALLNASAGTSQLVVDISGYYLQNNRAWIPEQPPSVSVAHGSDALTAVSCASAGNCTAVGTADSIGGNEFLVETLSGGTWTGHVIAGPSGSYSPLDLQAISCPAVDSCVAVGTIEATSNGDVFGVVASGAGATWTVSLLPLPSPGSPNVTMGGISCPAVGSCVAVGSYTPGGSVASPQDLIETLASGTWTASAPVTSTSVTSTLTSVSCPSTISCFAIGSTLSFSNSSNAVLQLSGGTWSPITAPATGTYTGISCLGTAFCVAVAAYGQVALYEGETWAVSTLTVPNSTFYPLLNGVVCTSDNSCVAAGSYLAYQQSGNHAPLVAEFNGTTWTLTGIPQPSYSDAPLNGISCPSTGNCVAVGFNGFAGPSVPIADVQVPTV